MSEKSNSSRRSIPQHHTHNRLHGAITAALEQLDETERHIQRGHRLNPENSETIQYAVSHLRARVRNLRSRIGKSEVDERALSAEVHASINATGLLEESVIALSAADRLAQRVLPLLPNTMSEFPSLVALQEASRRLLADTKNLDVDLSTGLNHLRAATADAAIEYSHLGA